MKNSEKKVLKLKFDYSFGPIWKDKYNPDTKEQTTGIEIIDNDKAIRVLDEEASRIYSSLYKFEEGRPVFDFQLFEEKQTDLFSLIETIISRVNYLKDDSFELVDEASLQLKDLVKAWDPAFVKLMPEERKRLDEADIEIKNGIYVTEAEMWVTEADAKTS